MCFDANTEDEITIVATGLAEGSNQRILFYDGASGSFEKAVSAPSCKAKVDEAKPLSFLDKDGKPVTIKGVNLPVKGQKVTQKIKSLKSINTSGILLQIVAIRWKRRKA